LLTAVVKKVLSRVTCFVGKKNKMTVKGALGVGGGGEELLKT
jgi:hypothetical protein